MMSVSSFRGVAGCVCAGALVALAFTTPAAAADLYTEPQPPPAAYGPPPAYGAPPPAYAGPGPGYAARAYPAPAYAAPAYAEEYAPVPPAPVPVYRPYAYGAPYPYWYGRSYWGGPRYAERPWGYGYRY